jgi:hypothetical protein
LRFRSRSGAAGPEIGSLPIWADALNALVIDWRVAGPASGNAVRDG